MNRGLSALQNLRKRLNVHLSLESELKEVEIPADWNKQTELLERLLADICAQWMPQWTRAGRRAFTHPEVA